jgi:hypothetical protein
MPLTVGIYDMDADFIMASIALTKYAAFSIGHIAMFAALISDGAR